MSEAITYCANHPDRETNLRCNNCDKLICSKCAVRTPTGYRCRECLRGQQKVFETARSLDPVIGFAVAAIISGLGALIAMRIGWFSLLVAPAAGSIIAEAVRRATGKRRSQALFLGTAAGVVAGGVFFMLPALAAVLLSGDLRFVFGLLWPTLYVVLATSTAYYRLSGIEIGRR